MSATAPRMIVTPSGAPAVRPRSASGEAPVRSAKGPWDRAVEKILNMMGPAKGQKLIDDTLRSLGIARVATIDHLRAFGDALIAHGGVIEAIGRSIKIQAILHGATSR